MKECPICKNTTGFKLLLWKDYTINRCKNCRLIYSTPDPTDQELIDFYQGFLFEKPRANKIDKLIKQRRKELKKLFDLSTNNVTGKKFLDYGGGTGIAYKAAKDIGFQTYYQDLDKEALAFVKENFDLKPEYLIESLTESDIKFDYILSDNVIEHVKYPIEFVREILNSLNAQGIVIIKTPNAGNTETFFNPLICVGNYLNNALLYNSFNTSIKAFFTRFWHCDPPRHLYSFDKLSLINLINQLQDKSLVYNISYYRVPIFNYTLTKRIFTDPINKQQFIRSIFKKALVMPFVLLELFSKVIHEVFIRVGILSPGGLILKIKKVV